MLNKILSCNHHSIETIQNSSRTPNYLNASKEEKEEFIKYHQEQSSQFVKRISATLQHDMSIIAAVLTLRQN